MQLILTSQSSDVFFLILRVRRFFTVLHCSSYSTEKAALRPSRSMESLCSLSPGGAKNLHTVCDFNKTMVWQTVTAYFHMVLSHLLQ